MTDIFISYAHADNSLVSHGFSIKRLTETLQDRGYRLWMDVLNIPGGREWSAEIDKGIKNAKCVLVIATENATRSTYIEEEIRLAHKYEIPIIPVFLDAAHLKKCRLDHIKGIDFGQPFDTALKQLIETLTCYKVPVSDQLSYVDLKDVIDKGTLTFGDAEKCWRTVLPFGKMPMRQ
jgi:hypothetical protein